MLLSSLGLLVAVVVFNMTSKPVEWCGLWYTVPTILVTIGTKVAYVHVLRPTQWAEYSCRMARAHLIMIVVQLLFLLGFSIGGPKWDGLAADRQIYWCDYNDDLMAPAMVFATLCNFFMDVRYGHLEASHSYLQPRDIDTTDLL